MINVGIIGVGGNMGRQVARAILKDSETRLVAAMDNRLFGMDLGRLLETEDLGIRVCSDCQTFLQTPMDVVVDFTIAAAARVNIPQVLAAGVKVVVGTTGLTEEDFALFRQVAEKHDTACFVAPNFAIGAVLMMKFAKEAVKYMPHAEVIELHHDGKLDAPSGTALKTLEGMSEVRDSFRQGREDEIEKIPGARGAEVDGMRVHSVRLPGLVAHQEVLLGGLGQLLTIRHDSFSRESFMPGVLLAVKGIMSRKGFILGLEELL